jgi:ribosome-associated toxin RatA of RatAB toxin-antitoxin module
MKRLLLYLVLLCAMLTQLPAHAQSEVAVNPSDTNLVVTANRVNKDGQAYYELHATGIVRATPQQTWKVLTTYDAMQSYVPNLETTKVITRNGNECVIEQQWVKHVLFFKHSVNLVVRATESPMSSIDIILVSGDMKEYTTRWEFSPIGPDGINGTRITYHGKIEPKSYMPTFFGTSVMLSDLNMMMAAVLAQIDKTP